MALPIASSPRGGEQSPNNNRRRGRSPRPQTATPLVDDARFFAPRKIELGSINILTRGEEKTLTTTTSAAEGQECCRAKVEKFKVVKYSKRRYELDRRYYAGGVSICARSPQPDALPVPGFLSRKKTSA